MPKWTYITVKDYEEMCKLADKYKLPRPSQIQAMKIEKERER